MTKDKLIYDYVMLNGSYGYKHPQIRVSVWTGWAQETCKTLSYSLFNTFVEFKGQTHKDEEKDFSLLQSYGWSADVDLQYHKDLERSISLLKSLNGDANPVKAILRVLKKLKAVRVTHSEEHSQFIPHKYRRPTQAAAWVALKDAKFEAKKARVA